MEQSRSQNLENSKQKIMSFINSNGPSVPVRISHHLGIDSILASAFLSELLSDKKLKISKMKVGSSPLYFIPGQEMKLENFTNYLSGKEREAFDLLREKKVLRDDVQYPAIRVALRGIPDFAFSFRQGDVIYWRYFSVGEQEVIGMIRGDEPKKEELIERGISTDYQKNHFPVLGGYEVARGQTEFIQPKVENEVKKEAVENLKAESSYGGEKNDEKGESEEKPLISVKQKKGGKVKEKSDFVAGVENFLEKNDFFVHKEIGFKKREYEAHVKVDSQLGKMMMLCLAKDKKSVTENDLMIALQRVHDEKMPVLIVSPGELNNKAEVKMGELGGLVFFKKLD